MTIYDAANNEVARPIRESAASGALIGKGGFRHFMLKEIFEQPQTFQNTMRGRLVVDEGFSKLGGLNLTRQQMLDLDRIIITACGTSWHSGLIGELYIEELARIPVEVEYASEFRYRNPLVLSLIHI